LLFLHFVLTWALKTKEGDEGKSARRVVPKMYREQIVKLCHNPPLAGHQGIERTIEKLKSRYYWRRISKDVLAYVKGCMECNTTLLANFPSSPSLHRTPFSRTKTSVYPIILASRVPYKQFSFSGLLPCLPPPDHPG
jgi:hypothetical protein